MSPACLRPFPHRQGGSLCCHPPSYDDGCQGLKMNIKTACYSKSHCYSVINVTRFFLWSSQGTKISHSAPWEISPNACYVSVVGDVSTGAKAQRAHEPSSVLLGRNKEQSSQFALTWHEQKDASQKGYESEARRLGTCPTGRG